MHLAPAAKKFIWHWGEMGTAWGISRSVAQIHALLYVAERPLNADEITETLGIARSNVSMSLKELRGWRIVRTVPVIDDRREHFETGKDVWEMFRVILEERKRREIDPTIRLLRECIEESENDPDADPKFRARMDELLGFFTTMSAWYEQVNSLPRSLLDRFVRLGSNLYAVLKKAN